ncbi:MAG: divergent polysaccharide deacetylase family protein [Deltaproteobacteria bacterium]|nr:divergent polysaccharide deacetylase family protein [Deltaproteobacteria bacterium]
MKKPASILWIGLGVFVLAIVVFILYYTGKEKEEVPRDIGKVERPALPPPPKVEIPKPKVAIVIDDLGQDIKQLWKVLEIDVPVTVAVLPFLPHSKRVAEEANSMGREVILHLPMEPKDVDNNPPGSGALFTGMTDDEMVAQVKKDLEAVPYVKGVNNHMGSKFTEDERRMKVVLEVVKEKGLYFLDSKTSGRSSAYRVARDMGIKAADRQVFLDNEQDVEYVKKQMGLLIEMAKDRGSAIAIGHPRPATLSALKEMVTVLKEAGVEIVPLSSLVD